MEEIAKQTCVHCGKTITENEAAYVIENGLICFECDKKFPECTAASTEYGQAMEEKSQLRIEPPLISNALTFLFKFIFPFAWTVGFGIPTIGLLVNKSPERTGFLILWILVSIYLYLFSARLKRVEVGEDEIYISNYFKTISVPLAEIEKVKESRLINTHPIWITFKNPTEFGRTIMFASRGSMRTVFTGSDPVVKKLRLLAEGKRKKS